MSVFATTKRPLSTIGRMHAANVAADAKRADREDLGNILKRRLRAEISGQSGSAAFAAGEWHRLNDPIAAPAGCGGGRVHPSRAKRLAEFMASEGWSADPAEPIVPTQTLDEAIQAGTIEARERLAAAQRDYEEYERTKHDEEPALIAETPRRGPGRHRKETFV